MKIFSRDIDGELLLFNYPLLGGWLPFIGLRTNIYEDWVFRSFTIEWFLVGFSIILNEEE